MVQGKSQKAEIENNSGHSRLSVPPALPRLEVGTIEVIGADGSEGMPYDDAIIYFDGDEVSEIRISRPGALRVAQQIVTAANNHDALVKALLEANEALIAANDYFDDRSDVVDGSYGEPSPNREMTLASNCQQASLLIERALAGAKQ